MEDATQINMKSKIEDIVKEIKTFQIMTHIEL